MSEKMSNAPVYYALAQAQFNPVAAMSKYADEIQDRLRKSGYNMYLAQEATRLQITANVGQPSSEPHITTVTSWLISKADQRSGFILGQNSLTYHTTSYETCDEFIPELLHGLKTVHEVTNLDFISRLGLRYLDAVIPNDDETVDQYLNEGLHGISFSANQSYMLNESVYETKTEPLVRAGTLVARVHRATGVLGYPPDMTPSGLIALPKFSDNRVVNHAVIDTDHFVEGGMPLDFESINKQLVSLHNGIKLAFNAIVTPYALDRWSEKT
jgi:uncharacterized protein (TIGR04255 family)